jgi:hypothetical protein
MMRWIVGQVPLIAGLLFLYTAGAKLLHPGRAVAALEALGLSVGLADSMVAAVIVIELYLGVLLALRIDLKYALTLSIGVIFVFTGFLWYLAMLADPPACGCLGLTGVFDSSKHEAVFGVVRNCAILWALKLSYDRQCSGASPVVGAPQGAGTGPAGT